MKRCIEIFFSIHSWQPVITFNVSMKKIIIIFIFLTCFFPYLFAQTIEKKVSINEIPLEVYAHIGFLFLYILLGFLFLVIFIFYPRQRLNLFFSLFNICLAVM